jgi:ADP-ribose pyrophosphatase
VGRQQSPAGSRPAYHGRFLDVIAESWPGREYEFVRRSGAAAAGAAGILATTPDGDVLLVRQFREPLRASLLEIPAGLLDVEGESPEGCARRELLEETGYEAGALRPLGQFFTSAGLTDERIILFAARAGPAAVAEPEEAIEVVRMPLQRARDSVRDGGFSDAKTAIALLLADPDAP